MGFGPRGQEGTKGAETRVAGAPPLTCCVAGGSFLDISVPSFLAYKMDIIMVLTELETTCMIM